MELRIFNVEHGFCAYMVADNNNVMLFDCGHNTSTGFRPTGYLQANGCSGIERLFITNYDEDHLSDLPNLVLSGLPILALQRNNSLSTEVLRRIKTETGPITTAMETLLDLIDYQFIGPPQDDSLFEGLEIATFSNPYSQFQDTNNLSLATFLHSRGLGIVIPGDLERDGWLALLNSSTFRNHLSRTNIFIASHHGRESGYCEEVFTYCRPDIIVISDESIQYGTQNVDYGRHASGVSWENGSTRYVLTTRNDGMITISNNHTSPYNILVSG